MLETANAKIDRFGWDRMDPSLKDQLCKGWCDRLSQYKLEEVQAGIDAFFERTKGNARTINEFQIEAEIRKIHNRKLDALPSERLIQQFADRPVEITEDERKEREEFARKTMSEVFGKIG